MGSAWLGSLLVVSSTFKAGVAADIVATGYFVELRNDALIRTILIPPAAQPRANYKTPKRKMGVSLFNG